MMSDLRMGGSKMTPNIGHWNPNWNVKNEHSVHRTIKIKISKNRE